MSNLSDELTNDPLNRGYADMTDEEVVADLETEYRTLERASLSGDECFQATDATEFGALTDHQQDLWLSFCARSTIDPFGSANVAFVEHIFGNAATTVSNLGNLRTYTASRAEELGLGTVRVGDIQMARS